MALILVNYTNPGPMLLGAWSPQKAMQVCNYTRVSKWLSFPFWAKAFCKGHIMHVFVH